MGHAAVGATSLVAGRHVLSVEPVSRGVIALSSGPGYSSVKGAWMVTEEEGVTGTSIGGSIVVVVGTIISSARGAARLRAGKSYD